MKEQYYKKIQQFEAEMKTLQKEKAKALHRATNEQKKTVDLTYKKKLSDLESTSKPLFLNPLHSLNSKTKRAQKERERTSTLSINGKIA
jgi:hypothetical protein